MRTNSGTLEVTLKLLAPLSHIGESHGTDSYLDTQTIIGPNGKPVEVFAYHGNAFRGMLRDYGAKYLLNKLASGQATIQVPLDIFYLLFSGGALGGDQRIDIDQARRIRNAIPLLSVFGGGVGNQILPGKVRFNDLWPVCAETQHLLPDELKDSMALSWRIMTTERNFSRKDDAKDENLRPYLVPDFDTPALPGQQSFIEVEEKKEAKQRDPQQMRYTIECLAAGSVLWGKIFVMDMTDIELGALTSAIAEWSKFPFVGGQNRIGFGHVEADFTWNPVGQKAEPFATIAQGVTLALGPKAQEAKQAYDQFLQAYATYLEENKASLAKMIAG